MKDLEEVIRVKNHQQWYEFQSTKEVTLSDLRRMRVECYADISKLRGRPLLVYAVKMTERDGANISINISDLDGFNDLVETNKTSKEVDILIHSPGGSIDATERIVQMLRSAFDKVHFLVPHSAYSAATMLCLSGDSIVLHPNATLGPIDPQINGVPARLLKNGFKNIKEKIMVEGPESLPAYIPLIQKFSIELLEFCDDTEKLAKILVCEWLSKYMFQNDPAEVKKINDAVDFFSNYNTHLTHSRPLNFKAVDSLGLKITEASPDLATLLWEAYVNIAGFFEGSMFVKLYEDNTRITWGRQFKTEGSSQNPEPS